MIIADGKTDNTKALREWVVAGGGILPSGIIRITDSIIVGADIIKDWTNPNTTAIDFVAYQTAKFFKPVPIVGNDTTIWLDNPDVTKPVIIYTAQGLKSNIKSGLIKDVVLKGSGIGILAAYVKRLRISNVEFSGFKNGLVLNNANFVQAELLNFDNCERAEFDIRSHNGIFTNTTIGLCKKGFEVRSNHIKLNIYYAYLCDTGLHIASANNMIDGCYFENSSSAQPQLIIGEPTGKTVNGNSFRALTIAAPNKTGIRWEKNAGTMTIDSGEIQGTKFEIFGTPTVFVKNLTGNLPSTITKL